MGTKPTQDEVKEVVNRVEFKEADSVKRKVQDYFDWNKHEAQAVVQNMIIRDTE